MVNKELVNTEKVSQAFNNLVSESNKPLQFGWEQTAASANLVASAAEREQEEVRVAMESLGNLSRAQAETLAALFRSTLAAPIAEIGKATEETRETLEKLSGRSLDAYRVWSSYLVDVQKRQASLVNELVQANVKALGPNQQVAESLIHFGETVFGWFEATAKELSPK